MIFIERTLHGKPYFPFCRRPEKMVFLKKLCWNIIFLALLGKMIFLFPENMILYLRRKMKDDLSQKNTWRYDIFFEPSEKMVFPRRTPPTHDLSCIIWRDGIFFPENIFFPFLRKYMEIWHFLCSRTGVTSVRPRPCVKKKSKMVLSRKNTPKGDWRSRLTSYEKLHQFSVLSWWPLRAFSCIALQRRKIGNLIYRIEVWPFLNLFCWRYSIANNIQYIVTFSQQ